MGRENPPKTKIKAGETAQGIKVLATKPDDLSSTPRTHRVVGEASFELSPDLHMYTNKCTKREILSSALQLGSYCSDRDLKTLVLTYQGWMTASISLSFCCL